MRNKIAKIVILCHVFCFLINGISAQELPIPTYNNSVIISIEHDVYDTTEVDYILNNFNFGLYAWPSFSRTFLQPVLGWHDDWGDAGNGIQSFKNTVNALINQAKTKNIKLHLVLCSGMSRGIQIYREAKEEDIRNCQWYNDNNLASDAQIMDPDPMGDYIYGTLSRYARKIRDNLEAKSKAAVAFLKQKMDEEPDVLIAISGWGEAELNSLRANYAVGIQDDFCDYSPFAILEFRDWICHTGMYDSSTGIYAGQGYSQGGTNYQGSSGLTQLNSDFGTGFTTWDLRYYNWSLSDDYDPNNQDTVNADPHRIPWASYSQGGMLPTTGPDYIAGGFDPPRTMSPGDDFYDLWHLFRETLVHHFVVDVAQWAAEAGIPAEQWYSHQIPGDYLFGTNPQTVDKNARYYSSASTLGSADIQPWGSVGATVYDLKLYHPDYGEYFVRTSQYAVPALASMATNWAVMEYDAETYPVGFSVTESLPEFIYDQYIRLYNHNVHLINFFRWLDTSGGDAHTIKGRNKEIALADFIEAIRDKARSTDLNLVYSPPKVMGVAGSYISATGVIQLDIQQNIWDGPAWEWDQWGDFSHFEVYRSTWPGFTPTAIELIGTTSDYVYEDSSYAAGNAYFYKVKAVNSQSIAGPASEAVMVLPSSTPVPILAVDQNQLYFGAEIGGSVSSPAGVMVFNYDTSGTSINWSASPQVSWLQVSPASGSGDGVLQISVNHSGLVRGNHFGEVWVQDPQAFNSPQIISVTLSVYRSGSDSPPFGAFDTPAAGATVSGNIPVTGWALDDIEVSKVEIKRSPDPDDPPGAIGPDGLVYIGDAVFVKGARPDVETFYPDYPRANRAGWGYMMLTYGLPRQGNGSFVLHAIAEDVSGRRVTLGTKAIVSDNASRVKPFGTIDTPAQGAVISGSAYYNWGWALTPQPNMIPVDGSTIWVSIDGVFLGHPVYGLYREDIATGFPGYANSDTGVGYFLFDTTSYENGVHNIGWLVTDDDGNTDGIGSRFFEIQNLGGGQSAQNMDMWKTFPEDLSGSLHLEISPSEKDVPAMRMMSPGEILRNVDRHQGSFRGKHADLELEIEELQRIVLDMKARGGAKIVAWTEAGTKGLPIGSTLDQEDGKFYWMPGPGFLGKHVLYFAVTNGHMRSKPIKVVIRIHPKTY